jgi:hypothetical protein
MIDLQKIQKGTEVMRVSNGFAEPGIVSEVSETHVNVIFDWHPHQGIRCNPETLIPASIYHEVSHIYPFWDWKIHSTAIH